MSLWTANYYEIWAVISFTLSVTEAADLLQKLSLDPQAKSLEVSEQAKKVVFLFDPFILLKSYCF